MLIVFPIISCASVTDLIYSDSSVYVYRLFIEEEYSDLVNWAYWVTREHGGDPGYINITNAGIYNNIENLCEKAISEILKDLTAKGEMDGIFDSTNLDYILELRDYFLVVIARQPCIQNSYKHTSIKYGSPIISAECTSSYVSGNIFTVTKNKYRQTFYNYEKFVPVFFGRMGNNERYAIRMRIERAKLLKNSVLSYYEILDKDNTRNILKDNAWYFIVPKKSIHINNRGFYKIEMLFDSDEEANARIKIRIK